MKQLRWIALLLCVLLLAGCAKANEAPQENFDAAPDGNGIYDSAAKEESATIEPGRKLIRTVDMDAETADLDKILSDLDAKLAEVGGYVQNKSVRNSSYGNRSATMTLRIPADRLDAFVGHIAGATNILSSSEKAEDVTLKYSATESRIKALETQETRLLELLAKAETLNDILTLEAKLAAVREELETAKSQLNLYDSLIDYGTVNLTITEVKEYTVTEEPDPTAWERIRDGFVGSVKGVWHILSEVCIALIIALPYLAIPGGIVLVLLLLRRRKKKKTAATLSKIFAAKKQEE